MCSCVFLSAGEQQHPGPSVSMTVRPDQTDITCIITFSHHCIYLLVHVKSCVNFHSKAGDAGLMVAHQI